MFRNPLQRICEVRLNSRVHVKQSTSRKGNTVVMSRFFRASLWLGRLSRLMSPSQTPNRRCLGLGITQHPWPCELPGSPTVTDCFREVSHDGDESSAEINHSLHSCSITKAKVLLIYMIVFGITDSHTRSHTKGPYDGMLKSVVTLSYIR